MVNKSATSFEEYRELKFDGNNNKRAVVSAFKNPASWLRSPCESKEGNRSCVRA